MLGGFVISKEMLCKAHPYPRQATLDLYPFVVDEDNKDLFLQHYPTADNFICSAEYQGIGTFLGKAMNLINAAEIYITHCKMDSAQKCWCLAKKIYDDHVEIADKGQLAIPQIHLLCDLLQPQLTALKVKLDALQEKLRPTTLARRCFLALLEHGITAEGKDKLSHIFSKDVCEKEMIDKMPAARLDASVGAPAPSASSALQPPPPPSYPAPPRPLAPFYPAPQPPENSAPQLGPKI